MILKLDYRNNMKCPKCNKEGLGLIINADGKKVLTEFNMFGETAHSLTCEATQ